MYARAGPLASLSCLSTDCTTVHGSSNSNSVLTAACSDNHKPTLASGTRTTNLKAADNNTYELSLRDKKDAGNTDMFVFNGSRTAPSKSYVLVFDQTTQKATLDRLDSAYTFNLQTKNGADVSAEHGKIYPKKAHKDSVHDKEEGEIDLFGEEDGDEANVGTEADAANPYDFRHFLNAAKGKKEKGGAEERGYASSPDARGSQTARSTANTPALPARRAVEPPKKRKAASVFTKKPAAKSAPKKPTAPTIHLQRKATEPASTSKTPALPPSSKIKSAEYVAESDDSDMDAEGDPDSTAPSPKQPQQQQRTTYRTYSPPRDSDSDSDEDRVRSPAYHDHLEIEIPDAKPNNSNGNLHVGDNSNAGTRSPSAGPISLASAANTPQRTRNAPEEIDFGSLEDEDAEGEEEEEEEEGYVVDTGPPAGRKSGGGEVEAEAEVDEDDPLYMEMMEGLAGGESSEESEEE
jgi:hypothetical protein